MLLLEEVFSLPSARFLRYSRLSLNNQLLDGQGSYCG